MINDADNTPVRAATFYGTPLAPAKNQKFLENSLWGIYNYLLGTSLTKKLRPLFDDVIKRSTPEQIKSYNIILNN